MLHRNGGVWRRTVGSTAVRVVAWRICLPDTVLDVPGEAHVEDGKVILRCGPEVTCALSADAAVITSDRLFRAGLAAKAQEREKRETGAD